MAGDLRRAVVLGPAGTILPGSSQDLRAADNRAFLEQTRTPWVRLWADWPSLEPAAGRLDAAHLAALDAQVAQARLAGLSIILTLYRFPTWANGLDALDAAALEATMPDRRRSDQRDASAKVLAYRPPDDVGPGSPWARLVETLATRYSRLNPARPSKATYVDWLEIANEPNLQWWPQQGPSPTSDPFAAGPPTVHLTVAAMLATAQAIAAGLDGEPGIMAPGTADATGSGRLRTDHAEFADALLTQLATTGLLGGPRLLWSHHNYADVLYDQGVDTTAPDLAQQPARATNRAAATRAQLVGRWAGWPDADPTDPRVFLTEGGATLTGIARVWGLTDPSAQRAKQADLLRRSWRRMAGDGEGTGIVGWSQYLFYSDPRYDCGLCEPSENGGAPRPAYDVWASLPSQP